MNSSILENNSEELKYVPASEMNNFDLKKEKKPACKGTIRKTLAELDKKIKLDNLYASFSLTYSSFDRLKIAINLKLYDNYIEFENFDEMIECDNPTIPMSYIEEKHNKNELYEDFCEEINNPQDINNLDMVFDDDYTLETFIEDGLEPDAETENNYSEKKENKYPNSKILYSKRKKQSGITNICIAKDVLYMDVTGKIMATKGNLGLITRDNIRNCFQKILDLHLFSFDIDNALEVAILCLCDVTLDIEVKNAEKVLLALSSYFPLITDKYSASMYRKESFTIKSRNKTAKSSAVIYNKGAEISHCRNTQYKKTIGQEGISKAKNTIRIELHLYSLKEIRTALDIKLKEKGVLLLNDALNSISKPILKFFESLGINEKEISKNYKEFLDMPEEPIKEKDYYKKIAEISIVQMLMDNQGDLNKTTAFYITELGFDSEMFHKILRDCIKKPLWKYLIKYKPKATREVLKIIDKIHISYGRQMQKREV